MFSFISHQLRFLSKLHNNSSIFTSLFLTTIVAALKIPNIICVSGYLDFYYKFFNKELQVENTTPTYHYPPHSYLPLPTPTPTYHYPPLPTPPTTNHPHPYLPLPIPTHPYPYIPLTTPTPTYHYPSLPLLTPTHPHPSSRPRSTGPLDLFLHFALFGIHAKDIWHTTDLHMHRHSYMHTHRYTDVQ